MHNDSNVPYSFGANFTHFGRFFYGKCPEWVLYGFLASFSLGSCFNFLECFVLLRCKRDGILSIILQINLVDCLLSLVALQDLLSTYQETWTASNGLCMFYNGTSTLANTLLIYLLICLNFHVITFWNLHNKQTNKNPLTGFGDGSSSECLVTRSDISRTVTIDYRKRKSDISVLLPVIFAWVLSVSISMPVYVLSTKVNVEGAISVCVLMKNFHGLALNVSVLVFSAVLPSLLLLTSLFILLHKLRKTIRRNDIIGMAELKVKKQLLIFSVVLTSFYVVTSYQRHIFTVVLTVREILFKQNYYYNNYLNVYQILWHYSGTGLRGLIFYLFVPDLRKVLREKLFCLRRDS
ncbi:uncharacterized protein LOC126742748 [Anthonomus grandis grandis]|uniref:uncharacterized protein LOC126742748 n=1 Tax=Anthonomus grandis grandis TaxID=2921223 RepID=UPI00216564FE|nr:uncharacterized protein LOC126742748 [Anthonomus grandis grandis]